VVLFGPYIYVNRIEHIVAVTMFPFSCFSLPHSLLSWIPRVVITLMVEPAQGPDSTSLRNNSPRSSIPSPDAGVEATNDAYDLQGVLRHVAFSLRGCFDVTMERN